MTTTMCTSGAALFKAGANVSTSLTEANYTQAINQAESYINTALRINFTDLYATLNDDVKKIFEDCCSDITAVYLINYDMSGYTSRQEALTMVNVLWARAQECIKLLKEKPKTTFIKGA